MISVFAYSRQGLSTARSVQALLAGEESRIYTMEKFLQPGILPIEKPSQAFYGEKFAEAEALIFVGACGIAVRMIAPFVKDKKQDPAVICIDELGKFVIPILSGHIGGANALAERLARGLEAVPVITTATDINGRFSVDSWAAKNGFTISSMAAAKHVSAAILEGNLPLASRFSIRGGLPAGCVPGESGDLGILLSCRKEQPFRETLQLIPKIIHLGIGCRKGISQEAVEQAVAEVLEENGIDRRSIACAASIDLKAQEQGLLSFCESWQLPITFYTARELKAVPGSFTPSQFVSTVTGVDNVCERSAMIGADRLIIRKTARNGVTVAAAEEIREVYFG